MLHPQFPSPSERPDQLAEALREQGVPPDELDELLPVVQRLAEWQAPTPSQVDTQHLLASLTPELPVLSPVRQAIRERLLLRSTRVSWLLDTARTQVSLFGPAFWLVSALVTVVGALGVLSGALSNQELLLRASGPFLAYLGTIVAFRGTAVRVLECELVCLPSPVQLALARLVVVLGYDVALGLMLSLTLWASGSTQVLALTLSWLMPLLLVAGLALLLSLRLSIQAAASVAYGSWLVVLVINVAWGLQLLPLAPLSESLLGGIGVALLVIALLRLQASMPRLLPTP